MFDIDGIYNAQNDRIWAVSREGADKKRWCLAEAKVSTKRDGVSSTVHQSSVTGGFKIWQQGLWQRMDVPAGWCQATYPCCNSRMVPEEFLIIYRQRPLATKLT
ncbi:unnamed protein product [Rotaria magnacalcarata]|uniref:Uncharacterized protein n=1 Tax=Rotaria magnacalcarata TaxID=392030 RepID=A0A8S3HZE5_9BILA|nr:unnamed protein product [Rotaria magnacalcarata]